MSKRVRDILPILVILAGLLVLLYPTISNFLIEQNASRAVASYDATVVDMGQEQREQMLADARAYNDALAASSGAPTASEGGEPAQVGETLAYEDLLNLNGDGMMGYIIIPRLKETLPIYHGTSEPVLQVGVGHLSDSSLPVGGPGTHAALSGHRGLPSARLFTDLNKMKVGDLFYIRVLDQTLAYKVTSIETVLPNETESLAIQPGKDLVTLITCTPYGINSHRLLVHAERTDYVPTEDELKVDNPIFNIPLPYLLLIIAVFALALVFAIMTIVRRRQTVRGQGGRPKHERAQE
ncbi:class C sortase [Bifidobacterium pullorum]|uniref:class C sortase n=1 Tax=Bifidobacterium pullorum TaxID=78448 RepID=UPI003F278A9D